MTALAPVDPGGNRTATRNTPRCRLRTRCDGTTTDLRLRRIRDNHTVRPMLCCDTCATGNTA